MSGLKRRICGFSYKKKKKTEQLSRMIYIMDFNGGRSTHFPSQDTFICIINNAINTIGTWARFSEQKPRTKGFASHCRKTNVHPAPFDCVIEANLKGHNSNGYHRVN